MWNVVGYEPLLITPVQVGGTFAFVIIDVTNESE